jgi:hypothetical protein
MLEPMERSWRPLGWITNYEINELKLLNSVKKEKESKINLGLQKVAQS